MNSNQPEKQAEYRVLARKYRPSSFSELIGQEAMVQTLTNAIQQGRMAHAFILTGVRGVGKTTSARIIARALNCIGHDGNGGPTANPCGVCVHCQDIAFDRHVDVIEMDAASRTGVDDIRELIEGARYRPVSARNKVYIIDEVHMLSKNAFNALLKTLEEPPERIRFIFATTEIRKVPLTVLSRCQRFDLRRVDIDVLAKHLSAIAKKEGVNISKGALLLLARAADGSVRDGLSLLDQVIASAGGEAAEEQTRAMLGLADRTATFDLMDAMMKGDAACALSILSGQYRAGADPAALLEDLLELNYWLTRVKVTPEIASDPLIPEAERVRGRAMADRLSMASLARVWQMLLKGLSEVRMASRPMQAAEMIVIRLLFASALPTPEEALKALEQSGPRQNDQGQNGKPPAAASPIVPPAAGNGAHELAAPASFGEVVSLAEQKGEMILHAGLISNVHLVHFEPGRIDFRLTDKRANNLPFHLREFLNANTDRRWVVTAVGDPGESTLRQQEDAQAARLKADTAALPLVKEIMETFPGAVIEEVR